MPRVGPQRRKKILFLKKRSQSVSSMWHAESKTATIWSYYWNKESDYVVQWKQLSTITTVNTRNTPNPKRAYAGHCIMYMTHGAGYLSQYSDWTMGWKVRDRIPVRTRFSAGPDRPWGLPSLLYDGYRVFPGGKVRPRRAADHSPLLLPWSWKSRAIPLPTLWATPSL